MPEDPGGFYTHTIHGIRAAGGFQVVSSSTPVLICHRHTFDGIIRQNPNHYHNES
jgi:hypothetical protein